MRESSRILRLAKSRAQNFRSYSSSPAKPSLNVHAASGGPTAPGDYCASLVQKLDREAWLTSYFWPKRQRDWFLAWRAFNLELHLITTTVTQPALAAIRFRFWKDALSVIWTGRDLEGKDTAVPQHPVAVSLDDMRRHRPVQRYYLSQLIETRVKSLSSPTSATTLESHLSLHGPLHSALLLGPLPLLLPPSHPSTSPVTHTLSHLSTLLTTVSLLKTLPVLVNSKRQVNIPHDIAQKHGIVEEEVLRKGAAATGLRDALYEIGTRGMDELITARRELKGTGGRVEPNMATPVFLAALPAEAYLQRLEKLDFDVFHPDLIKDDWRLAPRIWWRAQTGKI